MAASLTHRIGALLIVALLAVATVSCKRDEAAKTMTPEGSVKAGAQALKSGDLRAFVTSQVPPAELEKLRRDWKAKAAQPIDPAEAKRFDERMVKFSADGATEAMMKEFEPKIAEFEREGAAQMPMLVGMITGMAQASIQQNKDLDEADKTQAMQMVNVLTRWFSSAQFTDRAKVRAALDALTSAARSSKVRTLAQFRALSFDDALDEMSRGFRASKEVLAIYGLPLDPMFDSVNTKVLSKDDATAKVEVGFKLLDTQFAHAMELVKQDKRWYGRKTAAQVDEMLADGKDDAVVPSN